MSSRTEYVGPRVCQNLFCQWQTAYFAVAIDSYFGISLEKWGMSSLEAISMQRIWDEILQPVAIPYLHSLGLNSILQDDNSRPHRAGSISDYLQNWSGEDGMACMQAWPQPHWTVVWSAWACCSCQSDQHNQVGWLVTNAGWRMGHCHSSMWPA